jgi:signal transduction histidine kinase
MGFHFHPKADTNRNQPLWPAFTLLIAVVVLPTAGVFWFMTQAMQNEQQAVQQQLKEVYRSRLQSATRRIQSAWREKLQIPSQFEGRQDRVPEAFYAMINNGRADAILFYQDGRRIYPEQDESPKISADFSTPLWESARIFEYMQNAPQAAAAIYEKISRSADVQESAMAMLAQARCLNKAGQSRIAAKLLIEKLGKSRYHNTVDYQGRFLQPNALLFSLNLLKDPADPLFRKTAALLADRLNNYQPPALSSNQRLFLMLQLKSLWQQCPPLPTFEGEQLAALFANLTPDKLQAGQVQQTAIPNIFAFPAPDRSMIALLRKEHIFQTMQAMIAAQDPIPGVRFSILLPGDKNPFSLLTDDIGDIFPSWQLAINLDREDPFRTASNRKITRYAWAFVLLTAGIALLSMLLAAYLRRQVRLTRLKNDLIATVSHELKTPLASMRLLVDTLKDGHYQDTQLVQEYLQMMSKENARLSRLIEDFLTFSRMERNKAKFDRSILQPADVVNTALEALSERLHAPDCRFELEMAPNLPVVIGDRDALVTVLVNLLDNALKYSGDKKHVVLRAFPSNNRLVIEVQDNGIGFPRSAAKKIFDRFYQVDQSLSRRTGGCGLGLSIVKFILAAHQGSITAKSQPGKGSTFAVQLPIS